MKNESIGIDLLQMHSFKKWTEENSPKTFLQPEHSH
jgi:hypothetical protein